MLARIGALEQSGSISGRYFARGVIQLFDLAKALRGHGVSFIMTLCEGTWQGVSEARDVFGGVMLGERRSFGVKIVDGQRPRAALQCR